MADSSISIKFYGSASMNVGGFGVENQYGDSLGIGIGGAGDRYGAGFGLGGDDGSNGAGFPSGGAKMSWSNVRADLLREDIEQSHHFTVSIDKINERLPEYYRTKLEGNGRFLPVKSMSFTHANIETMNIPLGAVGSLPILHRKNLGKLTLTFYDNDREPIERAIRDWVNDCFPYDRYVNYLSEITGELIYTSYGVTGKRNENVSGLYYVIPVDDVRVARGYDVNDAKYLDFSVAIIGKENIKV